MHGIEHDVLVAVGHQLIKAVLHRQDIVPPPGDPFVLWRAQIAVLDNGELGIAGGNAVLTLESADLMTGAEIVGIQPVAVVKAEGSPLPGHGHKVAPLAVHPAGSGDIYPLGNSVIVLIGDPPGKGQFRQRIVEAAVKPAALPNQALFAQGVLHPHYPVCPGAVNLAVVDVRPGRQGKIVALERKSCLIAGRVLQHIGDVERAGLFVKWVSHGRRESAEELTEILKKDLKTIYRSID